jgi:hypothetical protein
MGIDNVKDLGMVIYSVMGISLLADKVVNVANVQGTAMAKPLIAVVMAWFATPKRQRNIITVLAGLASLGFGLSNLGLGGTQGKGQGVYGQRSQMTANVLGRLP